MSSLNPAMDAALIASRNKLVDTQQPPVEAVSVSNTPTEEPVKPVAQEAPKETPKVEPKPEPKKEEPIVVKPWDADEDEPVKTEAPKFDFSKVGSALDLGEIKSEEEFIAKASELKSKFKELQDQPLAGIPDELKDVIEVTKRSGDWRDYLAQLTIDYSKLDPIQLYEDEFLRDAVRSPRYQTEGKYDHDKALAALDAIPEVMREQMGKQIQYGFIQNQRQKQAEIKQKAEQRAEQAQKNLATASKNISELLPLETYGIKFEPKHSEEVYQGIVSSKLTKKHLGGLTWDDLVRSGADMKSIVRTITMAEKGEKMIKYKSDNSKVQAKKEVLETIQNVQLNNTGSQVQVEEPEKREKTPAEKLREHFAANKVGL